MACATLYTPKIQMLLRAAHWNCARKQDYATQLKSLYVNGALSSNPPPQPFYFEYAYPSDCLKVRFVPKVITNGNGISPPLTSSPAIFPVPNAFAGFVPFVVGLDTDASRNPVRVILTNQPQAQVIYTADISQVPDLWDPQFEAAAVSTLAAYLINALARNAAFMKEQVAAATAAIAAARATDGNEALPTQDHMPDFLRIRFSGSYAWGAAGNPSLCAGWDAAEFPGGIRF